MFTTDDLDSLQEAIDPFAWMDMTPTLNRVGVKECWWLNVRMTVKPPAQPTTSDEETRAALLHQAELALASLGQMGWEHLRVPNIELSGEVVHSLGDPKPHFLHRCDVRVEITRKD